MQAHTEEYTPSLLAPGARVLIVDDNEMNLEVIGSLLEETKIRVTTASSGPECLELLKEKTFDVVFLDQMMPGMSGTQTLTEIKKQKLAENTPIISPTSNAIVAVRDNYL